MNTLKKSLIGLSLFALLAGCSSGVTSKSSDAGKYSDGAKSTEVQPEQPTKTAQSSSQTGTDPELQSLVGVKIADGKVELNQPEVTAGAVEFNIRNEMTEPLHVSLVKTTLSPSQLRVKDGMLDKEQSDVEIVAEHSNPVKAGQEETIAKMLQPGDYELVVTAQGRSEPVAHTMVTVKAA